MNEIPVFPKNDFADEIPQMYAPFKNYVIEIVPLMLEHIWFLSTQNNSPINEEIINTGWLCRLITLDKRVLDPIKQNEIVGWPNLRDQLIKNFEVCKEKIQLPDLIGNCMQLIKPIIEKRFTDGHRFTQRPFHCWWYTIHDNEGHLALHLVNTYQPDSPFEHMIHFLTTMYDTIQHARTIYPAIKIVSCGSWLNQLPKFQELWPESFTYDQKLINETGGFGPGAWGQYMTVVGGFNREKADILRKTGKHPFPLTEAQSSIDEVVLHLKKMIANTVSRENHE